MRNNKKNQKVFKVVRIVSLCLLAVLLIAIVYIGSLPQRYNVTQGQSSDYDITATRSVTDSYETERRALLAKTEVSPIYVISDEVSSTNQILVADFFNYCSELRKNNVDEYGTVLRNKQEMAELMDAAIRESYEIELPADTLYTLANISFVDYEYVRNEATEITNMICMDALDAQALPLEINNYASAVADTKTYTNLNYVSNSQMIYDILTRLLKPNAVYDAKATENAKTAAYKNAISEPVMIQKGTRIVSVGETITPHIYSQLKDLDVLPGSAFDFNLLIGIIVYVFIIFVAGAFYLMRYERRFEIDSKTMIALVIAFVVPLISSRYLTSISPLFSTIMFTTVIFATYLGIQSGITMSCLSLLVLLPMSGFNTELFFVSLVSIYVCSVIAGQNSHKYNSATLIIFTCLSSVLASFGYNLVTQSSKTDMFNSILWSVIGSGCSVVAAIGSQPIFELISNTASPMRLLDLAQQSHPLQKRLFLEAPGTSQHSMMVANLADSAAEAIGANALLAKVGSYYHDIGKLERPEYFTENQQDKVNPHDQLSIAESVEIITSHPSDGLKLAKKYRLPLPIQSIILEHHGTTCPEYFYMKAKKQAEEKGEPEPNKEDFRYKGTVPSTKESAIIMIADSCEAAVRSRGIHDVEEAEVLFRKIIKSKIDEDQLVRSGLSFNDIELIIGAFLQVYAGFFHERVKYPDEGSN
ncbi:MAG: HDIG domain-containing protein [Clostridiales bacterium]|nr:HDIG domain-containing protein [Clostridiales bacterium]